MKTATSAIGKETVISEKKDSIQDPDKRKVSDEPKKSEEVSTQQRQTK